MEISVQSEMPIQCEIFSNPCIVLFTGNPVSEALDKQKAKKERNCVVIFWAEFVNLWFNDSNLDLAPS